MNDRKREAESEREREPGAGKRSVEVTQLVYYPLPTLDIYNKTVSDPGFKFQTHPAPLYNSPSSRLVGGKNVVCLFNGCFIFPEFLA